MRNMHAFSTNQIADILHFNDKVNYGTRIKDFRGFKCISNVMIKYVNFWVLFLILINVIEFTLKKSANSGPWMWTVKWPEWRCDLALEITTRRQSLTEQKFWLTGWNVYSPSFILHRFERKLFSKFLVFPAIVKFISERSLKISLKRCASDAEATKNTTFYR